MCIFHILAFTKAMGHLKKEKPYMAPFFLFLSFMVRKEGCDFWNTKKTLISIWQNPIETLNLLDLFFSNSKVVLNTSKEQC